MICKEPSKFVPQKCTTVILGQPNIIFLENALKKLLNIFSNFFFYLKVQSLRLILENNFIQMAASAGHAVFHQWLHEYCPLKRQLSLACRRNTLTVLTSPCSFSKKNATIIPQDQNPQKTVTRVGCVGFSMYAYGFSVP